MAVVVACGSPDPSPPLAGRVIQARAKAALRAPAAFAGLAARAAAPSGGAADAGLLDAGDADAASADDAGVDAGPPSPCPDPAMARIGKSCIDRWEAHLVAAADDGGFAPWPHNERPPTDVAFRAEASAGAFPQAYISRVEAKAACTAAGKRLCSMREWRRACQGPTKNHYPYGPKLDRSRCNIGKPHLLALHYGSDARRWKYDEHFNDPALDAEEGFLGRSGEYARCESEAGVFDTAGNLHEWVSDMVDEAFVELMDKDEVERHPQPWKLGNGVFVGGFFSTTDQHGPGCLFTTIAHEPTYHDYSIGFRCCANATVVDEPKPERKKAKKDRGKDPGKDAPPRDAGPD